MTRKISVEFSVEDVQNMRNFIKVSIDSFRL